MSRSIELEESRNLQQVHLLPFEDGRPSSSASSAAESRARLIDGEERGGDAGSASPSSADPPGRSAAALAAFNKARHMRMCKLACLVLTVLVIVFAVIIPIATYLSSSPSSPTPSAYATLAQCLAANRPPNLSQKQTTPTPGATPKPTPPSVLIQHASLWSGVGPLITDADVLLQNGKIAAVSASSGQRLPPPADPTLQTYDATGFWVTPGLVDLHSHAGLGAWPEDIWANDDVNEMTAPTFPQLRAVDALDPLDPAFALIRAGGVTSSQLMPGSGDAMGGEGALIKNRGSTVQEMLFPNGPRLLKMACGENVKRVFGKDKGVTPMSRLGSAWVMRQRFEQGLKLKNSQDDWCLASADVQAASRFPNDRQHESIAALLRGEARLNTHCYLTHDFEMMLRLSQEFNFTITTFHHALSAWRIADQLAARGINVATFSDLGLYKQEAYDASTIGPAILNAAGVRTILKSDHPVTFSGAIMWEAAKAHHYGLPAQQAIAAVTSNPAAAAGIDASVGQLTVGYDADVVVWNMDPLVLGAAPRTVFIDGERLVHNPAMQPITPAPDSSKVSPDMTSDGSASLCGLYNDTNTILNDLYMTVSLDCYAIVGVTIYTPQAISAGTMVVQQGLITCLGDATTCPVPAACQTFKQTNGVLMPGLVEAGSRVGLFDISSEDATGNGHVSVGDGSGGSAATVSTLNGLRFRARHVRAVWAAGITSIVARPQGSEIVSGQSSAFRTCCGANPTATSSYSLSGLDSSFGWTMAGLSSGALDLLNSSVILGDGLALHVNFGNNAKNGGITAAISGQYSALLSLFESARALIDSSNITLATVSTLRQSDPMTPFIHVLLKNKFPLAVEVYHADEMLAVLRLQVKFGFQLVLMGATEAHLIASQIASTNPVTKVLYFSRPLPASMETLRISPQTIKILRDAKVPYAISTGDTDNARNLRWEAGWNQVYSALTDQETVAAVTANVAALFPRLPTGTGQLVVGNRADFVLFNGSPFSLQSYVQLVGTGSQVDCRPKQR